jgi:hypothetical protein
MFDLRTRIEPRAPHATGGTRCRPTLEVLEDRTLLSTGTDIQMLSDRTADSQSLTFDYAIVNQDLGQPFDVGLFRSQDTTGSNEIELADVVISANQAQIGSTIVPVANALAVGSHEVTVPLANGLPPDPALPYVIADANPGHTVPETDGANDTNNSAYFRTYTIGVVTHGYIFSGKFADASWVTAMANALQVEDHYDVAIAFNWANASNKAIPGVTIQEGARMARMVEAAATNLPLGPNDTVDVHFIGHSRGAVVISQALEDLQNTRVSALQEGYLWMTMLDPHPANNNLRKSGDGFSAQNSIVGNLAVSQYRQFQAAAQDPQVVVPPDVDYADDYFQHTAADTFPSSSTERVLNLWGENHVIDHSAQPVHYTSLTSPGLGHSEVHDWYMAQIIPQLGGAFLPL